MVLVPEREGEQPPQLPGPVLAARDVLVEDRGHRLRPQVALTAKRLRGERLAREAFQLVAKPRRGRDREAALAPVHHLPRQERRDRLAQQPLLLEAANLVTRGQRQREVGHHRVEKRHACLERPGHRGPIGLHQQVVDEVAAEVDVLEPGHELVPLRLGEAPAKRGERIADVGAARELGARVGGEDLLPAVVSLERRQVRGPDEPLRLVVEAGPPRRRGQQLDRRPRHRGQRPGPLREQVGDVGVVPAEELVAALARERDLDVLGGEARDEVGRQRGRVGEGLVEGRSQRRQKQRRVRPHHELAMARAVQARHGAGSGELVERLLGEADRERPHGLRALLRRERGQRPRVDAAGEQDAHRDVRDEMRADRVAQARAALLHELGLVAPVPRRQRARPRVPLERGAALLPGQHVARGQLPDLPEDRQRRRDRVEGEERVERLEIEVAPRQRVELRRERELTADVPVVERLDAEAVAGEHEAAERRIPDRDREHAAQTLDEAEPPLLVRVDDRLGVGMRAEPVSGALELARAARRSCRSRRSGRRCTCRPRSRSAGRRRSDR